MLIRLGEDEALSAETLKEAGDSFALIEEEYAGDNIAFIVEDGEKEYSFDVAGIKDGKVEVLWRYTIGGSSLVHKFIEPELISMKMD